MEIKLTSNAENDLKNIEREMSNEFTFSKFHMEFKIQLDKIKNDPNIGKPLDIPGLTQFSEFDGTQQLHIPRTNSYIIYKVNNDIIEIVHIHTRLS